MKGALGLIAIAIVVWGFWMTWEWLRNPERLERKRKRREAKRNPNQG